MVTRLSFAAVALLCAATAPLAAQTATKATTVETDGGFTFRWSSSSSGDRSFRAQQYLVAKGHVGLQLSNLTEGLRGYFGVPTGVGVLIAEVQPDGPADRAGLRPGDVIVDVEGTPAHFAADVLDRVGREGGNDLAFGIVRDKRSLSVRIPVELQQTRVVRLRPNLGPGEAQQAGQNEFTEFVSPTDLEFTMDQLRLFVGGEGLRRNVERLHSFDAQEFETKIRALEQELAELQAQLPEAPVEETHSSGDGAPPSTEITEPDR